MSYQVLARKWRPQTFLEMAGQDHVLQALVNALRQQRLHHAYLFTGTRGVGKTTIARIFAKCLNCETNGISPEPCGTCDSCREIAEGRFVDLIEVDAASRTKVEDTRELLENVQYAPTRGRFKVYLIDEVHMLSTHSFNALLKTLEEPPAHVKFLLATTDPQKLPVTILSRCLQFNLKNMTPQRVVDYLQTVLQSETIEYDQPALWQIGQAANGSMRDALSLTDQAIAFGNGHISESGVTAMLGLVNQSQVLDLLETVVAKQAAQVMHKIELLADYQPDFSAICGSLMDCLHRVAIEQQVPGALQDQLGDLSRIQAMASQVAAEEIQIMYQSLLVGKRDLHLAHSVRAGFEMLMLRLIAFRPAPPMTVSYEAPPVTQASASPEAPVVSAPTHTSAEPVVAETPVSHEASSVSHEVPPAPAEKSLEAPIEGSTASASPETSMPQAAVESISPVEAPAEPVSQASSLPQDQRPPWEESDAEPAVPESPAEDISEEPVVADSMVDAPIVQQQPDVESDEPIEETEEVPVADSVVESPLESSLEPEEKAESFVPTDEKKPIAPIEDEDEEDEEEAEERAISDVLDPYNASAALVEALNSDVEEDTAEEEPQTEVSTDNRLAKIPDRIAQPALGIPVPEMSHYNQLTMKIWWLVAPRLALSGLVHNILMNSSLIESTDQGVRLQVPLEYGHMLNQTRYEQIQNALSDFFGIPVPLIIDTVEDVSGVTAEEFAASKRAEALQVAIDHLNAHPVVQALSTTMGAQLIYDTVKVKA
ncbi:DNA polymerase III subunit gamma/tau [Marinomonas dokdonensis]|uniref:DNA polymerase III subunit gamma/tau n=1 Tax=Marinomonas dokdonensis TaxID=328224 RepID=UPI00405558EC